MRDLWLADEAMAGIPLEVDTEKFMKTTNTREIKIYIAGDLATIEHNCRRFCIVGLCVTVTPTRFIFTGGAEDGACIGLINYARFPTEKDSLDLKALVLAETLLKECCQRSCSIVTPEETHYLENPDITIPK